MSRMSFYLSVASLTSRLLLPLGLMRWLVVISIFAWISGALSQWWFPGWGWLKVLAMMGILLVAFILLVALPSQVTALASSRQVNLLGNIRRSLLLLQFVASVLVSLIIYWAMGAIPGWTTMPSMLLVVWLMVSILLQFSQWVYSHWPGMQGLIFVLNMLFDDVARWLSEIHPSGLMLALVLGWTAFAYWWFRWQPKKYQTNFFLLSSQDSQKLLSERQGLWLSGHAHSWIGSRLSGLPDGWRAIGKRIVLGVGILLLLQIPLFLIGNVEQLHEYLLYGSRLLLLMGTFTAFVFSLSFYRHLRCIWLYSPGSRQQLFSVSWWRFLRMTCPSLILLFTLAFVLELLLGSWRGATVWLLLSGAIFLFLALMFHLLWFVYQQSHASINWGAGSGLVLLSLWFFSLCATGLVFPLPFDWQGISLLWIFLPEIAVLLLLHHRVRTGFAKMNLLRAV